MEAPVSLQAAEKTNDRSKTTVAWAPMALRALAKVAPGFVEERALDLWSTPLRTARVPEAPGLTGHRFRVEGRSGRLWVWDFGVGPTVLLVHGWSGNAGQMSRFIGPLVAAGFNAVAMDLPAHGQSGGQRTTLPEMAEAIPEVAEKVKPVTAVVAHSLGATAAALAHAQGLKLSKLALLAPPSHVPYYVKAFAHRLGLPDARAEGMLARLRARFGDLERFDLTQLAPGFTASGLVLHAPGDREVPFAQGEAVARAWPGARLEVLQKPGSAGGTQHHWPLRDDSVVRTVVSFLSPPPAQQGSRRAA